MSVIHLQVITPERTLLSEDVAEITLPTKNGEISILPNHMPFIAEIESGEITIKNGGEDSVALVYGGFVYVKEGSEVLILADAAEHLHELNETEIAAAKKHAEDAMKSAIGDKERIAEAEAELARISTQLKSLGRHPGVRRHRTK